VIEERPDPNLGVIAGVRLSLADVEYFCDRAYETLRRARLIAKAIRENAPGTICTHAPELRIKGGYDGAVLPRMPLRFGSAEVEACHGCGKWRMNVHAPNEWHEGPYAEAHAKAKAEEDEA
jgi:hypothetical protein